MPDRENRIPEAYACVCGTTLSDKRKSLKKHLTTKGHLDFAQCPPHHFQIDASNGPMSAGACIKCGLAKHFENSINYGWSGYQQKQYEDEEKQKEEKEELEQLVTSDQ